MMNNHWLQQARAKRVLAQFEAHAKWVDAELAKLRNSLPQVVDNIADVFELEWVRYQNPE